MPFAFSSCWKSRGTDKSNGLEIPQGFRWSDVPPRILRCGIPSGVSQRAQSSRCWATADRSPATFWSSLSRSSFARLSPSSARKRMRGFGLLPPLLFSHDKTWKFLAGKDTTHHTSRLRASARSRAPQSPAMLEMRCIRHRTPPLMGISESPGLAPTPIFSLRALCPVFPGRPAQTCCQKERNGCWPGLAIRLQPEPTCGAYS